MKTSFVLLSVGLLVLPGQPTRAWNNDKDVKRAREAIEELGGRVRVEQPAGQKPYLVVSWRGGDAIDKDLVHLAALPGLRELILDCPKVTDAGLVHLQGLTGLREVRLCGQRFTNAGMRHLERLTGLKKLYILTEELSDEGLGHLGRLTGLEKLALASPKITDLGLRHLGGLKKLAELELGFRSKVTDEGIKELQKSLPGVVVTQ